MITLKQKKKLIYKNKKRINKLFNNLKRKTLIIKKKFNKYNKKMIY